tara:strand:+ start:202 stop:528 length:327 start_codon:yes stop_codon:yes gene_type:complete
MNEFTAELKKGNFIISECQNCAKIVWPPSDYCNNCFNGVTWRKVSLYGKLIEWSKKGNDIFCISEFENTIRIIGKLDIENKTLRSGKLVKLAKCSLDDKHKFFFTLVE